MEVGVGGTSVGAALRCAHLFRSNPRRPSVNVPVEMNIALNEPPMTRRTHAFTLIDLLVVIAVIAVLIGVLLPSLGKARDAARTTIAQSACRSLVQAYTMYADDHKGRVLPAHLDADQPVGVQDEFGNAVGPPVSQRWVYRLAPYFNYGWGGTTHVGTRKELLSQFEQIHAQPNGDFNWSYQVSVFPSFGINRRYAGGDYRRPDWLAQNHHVRTISQPMRPDHLIAFASSRFNAPPMVVEGYIDVEPPPLGATYDERASTAAPGTAFGYLHPRYAGGALCGFFDGHVGLLRPAQLLDRTVWSDSAARRGDANWEP